MRTATALWWFLVIVKEISSALQFISLVGTFSVVLIYVPSTESDSQAVSGGI